MKFFITILFFISGIGILSAQTMKEAKLRQQLYEVANKYITSSDLSEQNAFDPKCEGFKQEIADAFTHLFTDSVSSIPIPNIYSDDLQLFLNKRKVKSKNNNKALYISFGAYYSMVRDNPNYKAFSYNNDTTLIIIFDKNEKKVKGNKYHSVISFSYQVVVCKGDKSDTLKLPVRLTCVYENDTTKKSAVYTYPKIEKVELEQLAALWSYDIYFAPYIGLSSGTLLFQNERIKEFENTNKGNQEFGLLMQVKIPNSNKKISPSLILGIGYRQTNFQHALDALTLNVNNEVPPFTPFEGLVTGYEKEIRLKNIKEETGIKTINIPLGMGFDFRLGNQYSKRYLYVNSIVNFGFPIGYKSEYSSGTVDYIGHFDIAGPSAPFQITIDDAPDLGFCSGVVAKTTSQNYQLNKINIAAELEAGYKYMLSPSTAINIGCFFSYGLLNDFKKTEEISSQITSWNGELESYPYFSNPTRNLLFGFRLSVQSFAFQLKRKNNSIGSYNPNLKK